MERVAWNRFCERIAETRREIAKAEKKTARLRRKVEKQIEAVMAAGRKES